MVHFFPPFLCFAPFLALPCGGLGLGGGSVGAMALSFVTFTASGAAAFLVLCRRLTRTEPIVTVSSINIQRGMSIEVL